MVAATFFWSGAFIAAKFGLGQFSPLSLTFLRLSIASLIMFPLLCYRYPAHCRLTRQELPYVFSTALLGMILYHLLFFNALRYTTAGKAAMINAINPLLTTLLALLILKEHLPKGKLVYVLSGFFGVILTITDWQLAALRTFSINQGDLMMLAGALAWAFYSIAVKKASAHVLPLKLTTYTFLLATLMLCPFFFWEWRNLSVLGLGWTPWLAVGYMALFPTVLGYSIQQNSIRVLGPAKTNLFIHLVPVFSMFLAQLILHETLIPLNLISGAIIIASVFLFNKKSRT